MRRQLQVRLEEARNLGGENALVKTTEGKSALDDENWFAAAARGVHGPEKTGTALYYAAGTGDERGCRKYAAGSVKPSANFLRRLLRTPQGWEWLCETMAGSDEPWWRDVQLAYAVERIRKELEESRGKNGNADGGTTRG